MKAKELNFMEELGNERIKEKFDNIKNDIFWTYAIINELYKVEDKDKEINFYNEHIEKQKQYLINCGYKVEDLDEFINEEKEEIEQQQALFKQTKKILGIE